MGNGVLGRASSISFLDVAVQARTKIAMTIRRIKAPIISAATPSSDAPPATVAMASPTTSALLHFENPRVVGISPARTAALKKPQARSAAA
jgi:hypothetical protein